MDDSSTSFQGRLRGNIPMRSLHDMDAVCHDLTRKSGGLVLQVYNLYSVP